MLSRRERAVWESMGGSAKDRYDWLLARCAAKDAVRMLMQETEGFHLARKGFPEGLGMAFSPIQIAAKNQLNVLLGGQAGRLRSASQGGLLPVGEFKDKCHRVPLSFLLTRIRHRRPVSARHEMNLTRIAFMELLKQRSIPYVDYTAEDWESDGKAIGEFERRRKAG